jgi:hypothetical protein
MLDSPTSRAAVSFHAEKYADGRPVIALKVTREGEAAAGRDPTFTLELAPDLTSDDADMLVEALNRCITHLGMASPGSGARESSDHDEKA